VRQPRRASQTRSRPRRFPNPRPQESTAISRRIFVGNLNYRTTEAELREFLGGAGEVVRISIPLDRDTGRPRGFAFVDFATPEQASSAIQRFDGQELTGRPLRIREAEERAPGRGTGGGYRPNPGEPRRMEPVVVPAPQPSFGGEEFESEEGGNRRGGGRRPKGRGWRDLRGKKRSL
jgi:RNA recognition motif-containing protein